MNHEAGSGKPRPTPTHVSRPYWDGLKHGEIRLQRCTSCGDLQFYPRSLCRTCDSSTLQWEVVGNTGVVYSATVIHRPPLEAFASSIPYVYAIVELDAGPRLVTNIVADDVESVRIGMPVTAQFDADGDVTLLRFRATD